MAIENPLTTTATITIMQNTETVSSMDSFTTLCQYQYNNTDNKGSTFLLTFTWCTVWVRIHVLYAPRFSDIFSPNGWKFLVQILHACYMFLSMLDYKFSFKYLQLWRSYTILSASTQFTAHAQNIHHQTKHTLGGRTKYYITSSQLEKIE